MTSWRDYQERSAELLRELGFEARTDVRVDGMRNRHDVDVLATYQHAGLELMWIVECKLWTRKVSKDRVLTLRAIVEDVGADKGLLLAESGYQSGAREATLRSNVVLSSLEEMRVAAAEDLVRRRLLALPERVARAHARYWRMPKSYREDMGLRPESYSSGYSASTVLTLVPGLITSALAGSLPPEGTWTLQPPVHTGEQAASLGEELLDDLEARLSRAEEVMPSEVAAAARERDERTRAQIESSSAGGRRDLEEWKAIMLGVPSGTEPSPEPDSAP